MKKEMVLSLTAKQSYMDQEPDVIELVTDGILENTANGWAITYEESALTGLEGDGVGSGPVCGDGGIALGQMYLSTFL